MKPFRDLLIRRKLTLILMLSSCVTLLLACIAWFCYDWATSREDIATELSFMGEIIGRSSAPAIDFSDVREMEESLGVLRNRPHIRQATLFNVDGTPLASYRSSDVLDSAPPIPYQHQGRRATAGGTTVYQPILFEGETIGTVAIESDLDSIWTRQTEFARIVVLVLVACLAIAFWMASKLQALISRPVMQLTDTMRAVSERKDYSLRARKLGDDEVGFLTAALNEMLAAIQDRDAMLERNQDTLEEEVAQRTSQLTKNAEQLRISMEEAREAAVAKSQFLANMSHEIRTPMNGVLGMNELLLDSPLSDQQRSYAEIVKSSAEALLEIINDILDFSKIEAGKLRLEEIEFEPYKTVEEVISLLSGPAHKKGLDLVCWIAPNIPPVLRGDPTRLRQVITNLVGNAVKFTNHGRISVRVEHVSDDARSVSVKVFVQDTGIGISREHQERLFTSFSQVDASTTRKYGGTGLGLAICRQLVELMGGVIGIESELGMGSTFWFTARFDKLPAESSRSFILPEGFQGPRLLIADSSAAIREVLHQQFESWGIEHEVAGDAARAFSAVKMAEDHERPFELVLLDDQILAEAGDDLLAFLSESEERSGTKVVLVSWTGADEVVVPPEIVVHGRLTKPIRPSQLFDAVLMNSDEAGPEEGGLLEQETDTPPDSTLRILLAEDNSINQLVATKILARGGFSCEVVGDGIKAFDAVKKGTFDLVLMDCQMPRMDGFEATRCIRDWERQTGRSERLHVIALTANAMKGDRERCIDAGMDDYLPKPVKPEVLIEKLRDFQRGYTQHLMRRREPDPDPDPDVPFDFDDLVTRYRGRHDELRAAVAKLDRASIDCLGRLKYCLRVEYGEDAQDLVHDLRDAIALISSDRLHALAVDLARLAGEGRFVEALESFAELQGEFERCRAHLPDVLAKIEYE